MSPARFKESLKLKPRDTGASQLIIGGGDSLPASGFGKDKKDGGGKDNEAKKRSGTPSFMLKPPKEHLVEKELNAMLAKKELRDSLVNVRPTHKGQAEKDSGKISFDTIRDKLRQTREKTTSQGYQNDTSGKPMDPMSLERLRERLLKPWEMNASQLIVGGSDSGKDEKDAGGKPMDPMSLERLREREGLLKPWERNASQLIIGGSDSGQNEKDAGGKNKAASTASRMEFMRANMLERLSSGKEMRPSVQEEEDWFAERRAMKKLLGENFYLQ